MTAPAPVVWDGGIPLVDIGAVYGPTTKQAQFLTATARHRYYLAGRFAGKTWTCALDALLQGLVNPEVPGALLGRTEMDLKKVILPALRRHIKKFKDATGINLIRHWSGGDMYVELINGSIIHWRGWEQIDKLRGYDLGWIDLDEAEWGLVDSQTVVETLLPAIRVPCPRPGIALFSSPNGLRGATKLWIERTRAGDESFWITHANSFSNPHVDPQVIEACKRSMSERRYRCEILAEAQRPVGAVFSQFSAQRHLIPWDWRAHPDHYLVFGIDPGTSHAAAVAIQVCPRTGRWVVIDELVGEPQTLGHWWDLLVKWIDSFGKHPYMIASDQTLWEFTRDLKLRYATGANGRPRTKIDVIDGKHDLYIQTGVTYIQDWLDPVDNGPPKIVVSNKLTRVADGGTCPLVPALEMYRHKLDLDGNPTDQILKDNFTDHVCDALRYAVVYGLRLKELHGGILPTRVSYRAPDGFHPDKVSGNTRPHF